MNNTDKIIKYLSGDLDRKSRAAFEKALETDTMLSTEYRSVLKIWNTIETQLALEDLPDEKDREAFIAELIAAHDIVQYRADTLSKKEQEIKDALEKVMQSDSFQTYNENKKNRKAVYRISLYFLSAAALILFILLPGSDLNELVSKAYQPVNDIELEAYVLRSRSENMDAMHLFKAGEFSAARTAFERELEGSSDLEYLFYAITCHETGDHKRSVSLLESLSAKEDVLISYKARWYLGLILIKEGEFAEARQILSELEKEDGMHQKELRKILRKIK